MNVARPPRRRYIGRTVSLDREKRDSEPIRSAADLVGFFRARERAGSRKVGIEHEKLGVVAGTTEPAPYGGPRGIEATLRAFERFGYRTVAENGHAIASERDGLTVSIEPGGQLELSGRPFADVHVVAAELDSHLDKCREIARELGLAFLAVGYRPWGTPQTAPWVPKARYGVMRPYLAKRGRFGEDMMAMTASTQASYDFASERDMGEKLRAALAVQPVVTALYANSPVVQGRPSGWKSYRTHVWTDVDRARQGLFPFAFEPGFLEHPYQSYVEFALDVPMIFLRRDGAYVDPRGVTFRDFLAGALGGVTPTMQDWEDHLTTLFEDVRVKGVVEVRAADSCDAEMTKAFPALWKGLLYDDDAREAAWKLVDTLELGERAALMAAVAKDGLAAKLPDGRSAQKVAKELLAISREGLCRQNCCGKEGRDERVWLEPLAARVESGRSPADDALEALARGGDAGLARHLCMAA